MTDVRPFRALRYDAKRADLTRVLIPPYDVISPEERIAFYERDPYCAIRLILTRDAGDQASTDYSESARLLDDWQREGVLMRDARPAFYGLRQRFTAPDGSEYERQGFFAALHLEDYERRIVRPHERTLSGPKADRLKLVRATRTNPSPIFVVYEDPKSQLDAALEEAFARNTPEVSKDSSGVENQFVVIQDEDLIETLQQFLSDRSIVIADGHHRYETALAYRDERRASAASEDAEAGYEFVLAYFANAYAEGTLLLPTHRTIRNAATPTESQWSERLPDWTCKQVSVERAEDLPSLLAEELVPLAPAPAFAADDGSGTLRIFHREARNGELAIRALHEEVIDGVFGLDEVAVREGAVGYAKDALRAAQDVRAGKLATVLYVNALSPDEVFRVTAEGEVMPQKSTFFTPKLPTGLVFRPIDDDGQR